MRGGRGRRLQDAIAPRPAAVLPPWPWSDGSVPFSPRAKISMRLVPDQEPHAIARLFEAYVRAIAPPTVEVDVALLGAARPALVARDSPAVRAPARAYRETFGAPPLFLRGGGSLPLVPDLIDTLGCPIVMIGFGLPDDNVHAPNEKLHLPNFYGGIEMGIRCLALLARE